MGFVADDPEIADLIKKIQIAERRALKCAAGSHDPQYHMSPPTCSKCGYDKPAIDELEADGGK